MNKQKKGITLIALVVTIIVLLILAGISISLVLNNTGIITKATDAKNSSEMRQAQDEVNLAISYLQIENATSTLTRENKRRILEDELRKFSADSSVSISGTGYKITHKKYDFFINEDLKISSSGKTFNAVEWDKKAAPEDVFIWKSDDPNNADYGVIIGYKKNVDNYTILRYPSRCTKLEPSYSSDIYNDTGDDETTVRSYTKNILKVEMPDTIKELGYRAFSGYGHGFYFSSLQQIDLPEGLEKIDSCAFEECKTLKSITIPENVKTIDSMAFAGWTENQTIKCKATKAGDSWNKYWKYNSNATKISANIIFGYHQYDFDAVEWDKKAAPEDVFIWKSDDPNNADYGVIIGYKKNVDNYTILRFPSRCTKISNDRNLYNSGLYKDTGDDQYTVRSYTKNILKVELPDTVEKLDESAFAGGNSGAFSFTSLERVELSKNLGKIENFTFDECENLKYIEIPDNITEIGDMSFWSCTTLQQINLPENLEEIGARTFENCEALESITIPAGVKEIKDYAFASCANLQQINLPEGLEKIGNCAFGSCGAIKSITIPAGVKEIGDYAFSSCTNLQQINLPEGLEKIGKRAFDYCNAIKSITIPKSVKSIDSWAFSSWTSSQTIKCKATKAGDNWDKYWNYNYGLSASSSTKISANIIFGYQDNNI